MRSWSLKFFFSFFFLNLKLFHRGFSSWLFLHALVQVLDEDELPELELPSSCHLSRLLLLAFMKKLLTVLSSNPSCWEMVICNSLDGRLFSLNIACRVRRWTSVKTNLGFLGVLPLSFPCSCSFLLHAAKKQRDCENQLPGRIKSGKAESIKFVNLYSRPPAFCLLTSAFSSMVGWEGTVTKGWRIRRGWSSVSPAHES